ncbi:MAG: hypothetical protein ACPGR8_06350 [Limisphaerales bacterium]
MSSDGSSLAGLVADVVNKQTVVAGVGAGVVATVVAGEGLSVEALGSNVLLYGGATMLADAGVQLVLGSRVGKALPEPIEVAAHVAGVGVAGVALLSLAGITTLDLSAANLMAALIMGGSAEASHMLMRML